MSLSNTDTAKFLDFMRELVGKLKSNDEMKTDNLVFLMDGARIHTSEKAIKFYRDNKIRVLINHSYTPEFNACEGWIALLKHKVRNALSITK